MKVNRILRLCAISIVWMLIISFSCQAAVRDDISILSEYSFSREEVEFTVSDTCSGHSCFDQVSLREDGWFATYTQMTGDGTQAQEGMFSRVYIDIFDSKGNIQKEIRFKYSGNVAIELLTKTVDIYLSHILLSYNWETDELEAWTIPEQSLTSSGLYFKLHADRFQQGEWIYRCHRTTHGYSELTRENGETKETLLSYSGNGVALKGEYLSPMVTGICVAALMFLAGFLWKIYKKKDKGTT